MILIFKDSLWVIFLACAIYGLSDGVWSAFEPTCLANLAGSDSGHLASAMGISLAVNGAAVMLGMLLLANWITNTKLNRYLPLFNITTLQVIQLLDGWSIIVVTSLIPSTSVRLGLEWLQFYKL